MNYGRGLMELERRTVERQLAGLCEEQMDILDDMSESGSLSSDCEDYLEDIQAQSDALVIALCLVDSEDTRAGDRVSNLDHWKDIECL